MPDPLDQYEAAAVVHIAPSEQARQRTAIARSLQSRNGHPVSGLANVVHILEHDPAYKGRLRYNELHLAAEWRGPRGWECITDAIEGRLTVGVEREYHLQATSYIHRAILTVADANRHSPVRAYLEALEWDGEARIDRALVDLFGADPADPLVEQKGRVFFLSAAKRGLEPGCKVDTMLILQGGQGLRKSSALRALFGAEWFRDSDIPLGHSQDKYQALSGVWGYEIAEMASFGNRDWNAIKAFVTAQVDRFRPSYARHQVTRPRSCVFAGTTNQQEFLRDSTGSRRFPVVEVLGQTQLQRIAELRDQLWAEAVHRIRAGEEWWFDKDTEADIQAQNVRYMRSDSWADAIEDWLNGRVQPFSMKEVLGDAVGIELDRQDARHANRARDILEAAGCRKVRKNGSDYKGRCNYEHRIRGGSKRALSTCRMWLAPAGQEAAE
jgi:predicted P-loop ATPase